MDKESQEDDALNKHSIGAKEECPIGNKHAKHMKKIEDIAENLSAKLGIVKKESMGEKHNNDSSSVNDARMMIG